MGVITALGELLSPQYLLMMIAGTMGGIMIGSNAGPDFGDGRDADAGLYLWHGPRGQYFHAAGHLLRRDLRRLHHRHPDRHTRHAGLGRHHPAAPNS